MVLKFQSNIFFKENLFVSISLLIDINFYNYLSFLSNIKITFAYVCKSNLQWILVCFIDYTQYLLYTIIHGNYIIQIYLKNNSFKKRKVK